jgi:Flp pilus assembly pilin Flp
LASDSLKHIIKDESGAAMVEMTAAVMLFFVILGGIVDGSMLFYQWNAATKAVQVGARLAAVSDPVAPNLTTLTGVSGSVLPGDPMPAFDCTCSVTSGTGSCSSTTGTNCGYDAQAMSRLIFGRNGSSCTDLAADTSVARTQYIGMCDYFPSIAAANVQVRYQYTGLGYAGRPGGPVPTVTVSVRNLQFNYVFLQPLLGKAPVNLPGFNTTVTGEDLRKSGS